jgi:hypothetical protein
MTVDVANDPHIRALREAFVTEDEATIAEVQQRADDAAERGDEWYRKWHQDAADRLRAMPYPWERRRPAA